MKTYEKQAAEQHTGIDKMRRYHAPPSGSAGDDFGFDGEISLFLNQNSLFRQNNSLFCCIGNFAGKPLNIARVLALQNLSRAGKFDEIPC